MSDGFLASADARTVAGMDQAYADVSRAIGSVVKGMAKDAKEAGDKPEEVFARLASAIPPRLTAIELKIWVCGALTQLVIARNNSEERAA